MKSLSSTKQINVIGGNQSADSAFIQNISLTSAIKCKLDFKSISLLPCVQFQATEKDLISSSFSLMSRFKTKRHQRVFHLSTNQLSIASWQDPQKGLLKECSLFMWHRGWVNFFEFEEKSHDLPPSKTKNLQTPLKFTHLRCHIYFDQHCIKLHNPPPARDETFTPPLYFSTLSLSDVPKVRSAGSTVYMSLLSTLRSHVGTIGFPLISRIFCFISVASEPLTFTDYFLFMNNLFTVICAKDIWPHKAFMT